MNASEKYSEAAKSMIKKVNCPYRVFTADNSAKEVNEAYRHAVVRGKKEGFVPMLAVADDTLEEWFGILEDDAYSKEKILTQERKDGAKILKERFAEYTEDYVNDLNGDEEPSEDDMLLSELMGENEEGEEIHQLSSFVSYTGKGIEETILFEIPVKNPWEVIAWLPMGGWNECPDASEMMEICRYWYEKYGAVPAAVSHDTLEFVVERPVSDEAEAWALAKEQYGFCPDRVDQGTATYTIAELADCLRKSEVWFFWWD